MLQLVDKQLFEHPIDTPRNETAATTRPVHGGRPSPIPFPDPATVQDNFERRAARLQLESERQQEALRTAWYDGNQEGWVAGWRAGARFGVGLGLLLGCLLIAASVVAGASAGLLP